MVELEAFSPGIGADGEAGPPAAGPGTPSGSLALLDRFPELPGPTGPLPSLPLRWSFQTRTGAAALAGIGSLRGAAPPSRVPLQPSPPPAPPLGCLGPGTVAPSVSNLALRALSAPSSGLWLAWGPLPWCPPFILPDPCRTPSGREASLCPHPSPTLWVSVHRGRGLCHPTQTGRASFCPFSDLYLGVFGEPAAAVSGI